MSANNTQTPPTSNPPPPPSSTPITLTPSSTPPPPPPPSSSSQAPPSSSAPPPSSSSQQLSTVTASTPPPSTILVTSVITPSATRPGETPTPVVVTIILPASNQPSGSATTNSPASSSTGPASLQNIGGKKEAGGLSTGGKTAIAVVVPVVVVALLVFGGILLWRRRKQKKVAEETRRKEVEEYGFNPNNDPTLPAVGMTSEMAEDQSGYRGWGNTTVGTGSSNRKASTTLTSGMTGHSDSNSNPGGYQSPGSPTQAYSDVQSNDPLMNGRRETLDSEGIAALGHAPNANQQQSNIHRGPSNASSHYSAANHSDNSGEYPLPMNNPQEYYDNNNYYHATSPYGNDPYAASQQPVIRDVSARRNTRIENPTVYHQGNSGIAQNF